MTIATLENYAAAKKSTVSLQKSGINMASGLKWASHLRYAGGGLAVAPSIGSTTQGVVPVAGDAGFPALDFGSNGLVTLMEVTSGVAARFMLYDRLFHCGPYANNGGSGTLTSQPSYSGRVPGGSDYKGLQLWVEDLTNPSVGSYTVTVTYTNQAGTGGQSTSLVVTNSGNSDLGWSRQMPLASGDSGVQKIESVSSSAGPIGSFNVFVARPIAVINIDGALQARTSPMEERGLVEVYPTSALAVLGSAAAGGAQGVFDCAIEIASN